MFDATQMKIEAARVALAEVQSGMTLGLGTGTTAAELVKLLGAALASGALRDIRCTCTSDATEQLAKSLAIPTFPLIDVLPIDIAIDGADEIDADLRMIKGRGGALLREKIVEQQARRFIVIADETKIVKKLGHGTLPIEVTPFAREVLETHFTAMGLAPAIRMKNDTVLTTDEGNVIVDVRVPATEDIAETIARIVRHAGVVETGFFPEEASEAVIAAPSGVRWMRRSSA